MAESLLEQINQPNDIKKIPPEQYGELAKELRKTILTTVSKNGGHLASNLGAVELTMALHLFMDFPQDKLVWDVGHQAYVHKLLTGRRKQFATLRKMGGMSGFPKRAESDCDAFDTGHSSTSISAAAGMVKARDLTGGTNRVVAVIGDGSMSGGLAYEALNNVGHFTTNMIIVLNDNEMSISKNVGGMANYLGKMRMSEGYLDLKDNVAQVLNRSTFGEKLAKGIKKTKASIRQMIIPGEFFTEMGLTYFGPVDGHDIEAMLQALHAAEKINGAVLIHVVTKKGKGYRFAEQEPSKFHGIEPFQISTGSLLREKKALSYTDVFGKTLCELAERDPNIVAITAAMTGGTGLSAFAKEYPKRFFDVGIAEEHAVTFAAGMASCGLHPVFAVYSTFLQRAYDQILHDVCINRYPVVLAVDRAGIVGNDGETHQGIFDLAYLAQMPGMTIAVPSSGEELKKLLAFACAYEGPAAIRYPRGSMDCARVESVDEPVVYGRSCMRKQGSQAAILYAGPFGSMAERVAEQLKTDGIDCTLVDARFAAPLDTDMLLTLAKTHQLVVTLEEGILTGGFGERVLCWYQEQQLPVRVVPIALPDQFLVHGTQNQLRDLCGLNAESVYARIKEELAGKDTFAEWND